MPSASAVHVLIIEDEAQKLRDVLSTVKAAAGNEARIEVVRDAQAARVFLSANAVDLAIVDIALPATLEDAPSADAGLRLLEDIIERDDVYHLPAHIVGLTAYEESFEAARYAFDIESWSLILYDPGTTEWRDRLSRKIKQIRLAKVAAASVGAEYKSFACIVTALESPELDAVLDLPWSWTSSEPDDDVTLYHTTHLQSAGGERTIVAASASRMGIAATTALAMKMIHRFRPRYVVMVGITAGMKEECNLGDIVVADPSWHWESGKHSIVKDTPKFAPSPHQIYIQRKLRNKVDVLRRDEEFFAKLHDSFEGDKPACELRLKVGPMASGSAVLSNESFLDLIRLQHRKALAVEMEAYGLYTAAQETDLPEVHALCMKGVSDFADGTKNDLYQAYAAYTSARAAQRLLEAIL